MHAESKSIDETLPIDSTRNPPPDFPSRGDVLQFLHGPMFLIGALLMFGTKWIATVFAGNGFPQPLLAFQQIVLVALLVSACGRLLIHHNLLKTSSDARIEVLGWSALSIIVLCFAILSGGEREWIIRSVFVTMLLLCGAYFMHHFRIWRGQRISQSQP